MKLKIVANSQRACLHACELARRCFDARPAGSRGWRSGRITSSKINAIASHGFRHAIAKADTLPDAVGQVVRVHRFFQAQGQRLYVAARQAAVGDEARSPRNAPAPRETVPGRRERCKTRRE
ncbi:hypothetical protein [Acidovorax sp. A1169]|uniref:hypothetical protein n=1 Tax=Acidovorax sp. A1169 TaxID=3059524 RepID=UPI0027379499|nr:hypothetical protein [Acidovorax sp. A1169]MDP4073883.1 hypothetical protein [Acidovorax sp. A1169]